MLVAIHQPEHLPWLGFFEKLRRVDLFVLLDDVQFSKGDFQNRNRVKGAAGVQWLTVPVVHRFPQKLNEVETAGDDWREKHWKTIASCYGRAPYFSEFSNALAELYRRPWQKLSDLNIAAIKLLATWLRIDTKMILSSDLNVAGEKSELVLNVCKRVGASAYYSGVMGKTYLQRAAFQQAGIDLIFQEFQHPVYQQLFMKQQGFVPNLSAIDLLFNCGAAGADLIGEPQGQALAGVAN
jgi:hypothetical protein